MHDVCISPAVCKTLSPQLIKLTVIILLILVAVAGNAYATDSSDLNQGNPNPVSGTFPVSAETTVSISPASVTLSSGAKQQFTAAVTGTPNTAVTWKASSGSIDSNGLYTAPAVKSALGVTITATSQSSSSVAAQADVTVTPQNSGALQITSGTYLQAQTESSFDLALAATGGTPPYRWSISSGQLPAGISLNTNGNLTGTPSHVGVFGFGLKVSDAANLTATSTLSMVVNQGAGYDGPAQLPLMTIPIAVSNSPAPGSVINVKAGDDLQNVLNDVRCGQTIQLQAGATFTGEFVARAKHCDANNWIVIRTSSPDSALPAEGQRLTPCYAGVASLLGRPAYPCASPKNVLAKLQIQSNGNAFVIEPGANFYRFIGLEMTRAEGAPGPARLMSLQGTADHIFVDRCWLHGQAQDETYVGFAAGGGTNIAVFDSYLNDFHCIAITGACTDSHAISGGVSDTQDGPYLIQNNFLEASGEAIMFGGGPATKSPADITVQYNHFWKPWQWMKGNTPFVGGTDGHPFIVKNHLELKNAVRVLVQGNLMENVWGGFTQYGHAIVLSAVNQHNRRSGLNVCPLCQVTDVTVRYSQVSHAGGGMSMATELSPNPQEGAPALAGERFSVHDIVMDDLSRKYVGGGDGYKILNGWPVRPLNTITINHTTVFPAPESHLIGVGNFTTNPQMSGFVFTNNLGTTGVYPIANIMRAESCAMGDVPITVLSNCFTTYAFQSNGMIASQPPPSSYPKRNFFPESTASVQFVDFNNGNGGNYSLRSTSPYVNAGTDGKNLGADIEGLAAALNGVE